MVSETINEEEKKPSKVIKGLKDFSLGVLSFLAYVAVFVMGTLAGIVFMLFNK
jgi:hypothetical protein